VSNSPVQLSNFVVRLGEVVWINEQKGMMGSFKDAIVLCDADGAQCFYLQFT